MYYLEDDEQLLRGENVRRCVRIENHIMDDQIIFTQCNAADHGN